jgi:RNA-splicing ligase RtcB
MIELKGKYNKDCKIFIDDIESEAYTLIQSILDQQVSENVKVRIMPDTHVGKGIVIGFCMPMTNMLNPNHIGCDIGCGMLSARFSGDYKINLEKFDLDVKMNIPMGFNVHKDIIFKSIPFDDVQNAADKFVAEYNKKFSTSYIAPIYNEKWLSNKLKVIKMDDVKFWNAIGTLGSGNHFQELGIDSNGNYWITIHSGSRNFGLKVADYWTNVAKSQMNIAPDVYNKELENIKLNTFPKNLIPKKIQELKDTYKIGLNKEYLQGDNTIGYLFDMIFVQKYAEWNRSTMLNIIQKILGINNFDEIISTVHNYIDMKDMIIRKGAIASYVDQKMIIPFNQKDGILLCEGKSNDDWLNSGPHGSGRKESRSSAKKKFSVEEVKKSMNGIYTTSVCKETVDESVFAYKNSEMIEKLIEPTATILDRIKPIWNVKDTGKELSWKQKRELEKKGKLPVEYNMKKHRTDKEKDDRRNRREMRRMKGR